MENHLNPLHLTTSCHAGSRMNYCARVNTAVYKTHNCRLSSSSNTRGVLISVHKVLRRDWLER